jgi:peptidoglycan/LPS O-acetylase OafA/YrhL
MKYRAEIDGLRALAVLPVVFFHADIGPFSGGYVGVDVFFVISGFLITKILIDELNQGHFSFARFYERRARRILPALFVMVGLTVPAAWKWLPPMEMAKFSDSLLSVALFLSNMLFWRQSGYFDTAAEFKPLIHTWSLAVEEQFYILFPVLLMLIYRFGRRLLVPTLLCLLVLSLILAQATLKQHPSAAFFFLPTRGWELLLGGLCTMHVHAQAPASRSNLLGLAGLGMIAAAVFLFDRSTPAPGLFTLLPTMGAALILIYARTDNLAGKLLSNRIVVGIGLISYSTYLWHQPILVFQRYALGGPLGVQEKLVTVVLALLLGYLSWRYIETPFRNRQQISTRSVFAAAVAGTLLMAAVGIWGHFSDGFRALRSHNPVFARDARIHEVRADRQRQIRAGSCHFDENLPIETFIAGWNCRSDDENLFNSRMAVFGDSHAADKVVALRLNGIDTWQITGAGCQVAPNFVKEDRKYCNELFRLIESQSLQIKGIVVANRFAVHELNDRYMEAVLRYWGNAGAPVIIFSPMPEFGLQQLEYARKGTTATAPSFEREALFFALLAKQRIPPNILVLKASDYWCAGGPCVVARDHEYLMTDEDHLSRAGAQLFGQAMLRDQTIRRFLGLAN